MTFVRAIVSRCLVAAALALVAAGAAIAHTRSESHTVWEINGPNIDLVVMLAEPDVARLGDGPAPASDAAIETYLTQRITPTSGGGKCALVPPVTRLSSAPGFRRYDLTFKCPSATGLELTNAALFDRIPSHVDFAQIRNAVTGAFTEQLVTADSEPIHFGDAAEKLRAAGFFDFVSMGVRHILTGVDHMSFLLGLVLISRRLRDLVFVITGFTLGHSLTLALAVTGVLRPHAEYIDALVALTILLIGAENVSVATRRPGIVGAALAMGLGTVALLRLIDVGSLPMMLLTGTALFAAGYIVLSGHVADMGRLRLVITLVFGLIHGFGFASDLLEMQLPTERLAELLLGFNVGVEIAQLALVVGATGLVALAARWHLAPPRRLVVDLGSGALVGIGTFWFVSRGFS